MPLGQLIFYPPVGGTTFIAQIGNDSYAIQLQPTAIGTPQWVVTSLSGLSVVGGFATFPLAVNAAQTNFTALAT
jgi:hypothetical protein